MGDVMTTQIDVQALIVRERIALATAAAMFVAGVLLVTVVLPAEYGVDPAGTGRLFGLLQIAQAEETAPAVAAGGTTSLEPTRPGANTSREAAFRRDTRTFEIPPMQGIEYKYAMRQGDSFVYHWEATGTVNAEFHGEPEGAARGYAEFYDKSTGRAADGSFFAPTTGIHGWWWENTSNSPITLTLSSAGFYTGAKEFRAEGVTEHEITE